MKWRCARCGVTNVDGEHEECQSLLGIEASMTCYNCGSKNAVMQDSQEIINARAIAQSTGCILTFEIDQSNHPVIERNAKGKLEDAGAGVCAIAVAHWIKTSKSQPSRALAFAAFKKVIDDKMEDIVVEQTVYMHEIDARKRMMEQGEVLRLKFLKANGGTSVLPESGFSSELFQLRQDAIDFRVVIENAHKEETRRQGGGFNGTEICNEEPIDSIKNNIILTLKKGGEGFFTVSYGGSGTGHVIGIEFTTKSCQLMDPNTGLWKCSGPPQLVLLFKILTEKFYLSLFGGFKTLTIFHYR